MINLFKSKGADESSVEDRKKFSLFLKAGESMNESDKKRDFIVNDGHDVIRGPSMIIADPTYDITFQAMFPDNSEGKSRLLSLLNSLLYPKCDLKNPNHKMIREVEFSKTTIEKRVPEGEGKKNAGGMENQFKQFRCDIVCNYTIGTKNQHEDQIKKIVISYYDIEMQRSKLKNLEKELLEYAQELKKQYNPAKVLTFLKYQIKDNQIANEVALIPSVVVIRGQKDKMKQNEDNDAFGFMISLPSIVDSIQKGEPIKIQEDGEELGVDGKEWLKLLGVSHWATQEMIGDDLTGYYYVPTNVSCNEVRTAMEFVKKGEIDPILYQEQIKMLFSAESTAKQLREEGMEEGIKVGKEEGIKEGMEKGMEKGKEKGMKEGMEKGEKKLLLYLMADNFHKEGNLGDNFVTIAKDRRFSFSEEEAIKAIEDVSEAEEEQKFLEALSKEGLIQKS